jgi:hypothetical protein
MLSGYTEIPRLGIQLKKMAGIVPKAVEAPKVENAEAAPPQEEDVDESITAWQGTN